MDVTKIVQYNVFINLLVKSLINKDGSTFRFVRGEFLADRSYSILYQAPSDAILLEIQPNITRVTLKRSIEKCLKVQEGIDVQVFLVVLCTGKIPLSVKSMLSPDPQHAFWQKMDSTAWAEKCVIINKEGINFSNQNLDPLVVLTLFFSNDEEQKMKLLSIGDPTMQLVQALL